MKPSQLRPPHSQRSRKIHQFSMLQQGPKTTGITLGFYRFLCEQIPNTINMAVNNILKDGLIPGTKIQGALVIILKAVKDPQCITNLRPITLLTFFYKIVFGCIAHRLKPGLDKILKPLQMEYLPGRYISWVKTPFLSHPPARKCKQGDPVAGYLLILDIDILLHHLAFTSQLPHTG